MFFTCRASKNVIDQHIVPSVGLPPLDVEGKLVFVPTEVIEIKERKLCNKSIRQYLVHWKGFPYEVATWEGESILQDPAQRLLEGKQSQEGKTVMSPSPR